MKIEILSDTIAANRIVKPGEIMELTLKDARYLIALGKAVEVVDYTDDPEFISEEIISDEVRVRRRARKP